MKFFRSFFLTNVFFYCLFAVTAILVISFFIEWMYPIGRVIFWIFVGVSILDILFLYAQKNGIKIQREYPERLSNGDYNPLSISVSNYYPTSMKIRLIEEIPVQLQIRNFEMQKTLQSKQIESFWFEIRPTKRGKYIFRKCNVFVRKIGFFERRYQIETPTEMTCYPSFLQLKKYQLLATTNRLHELGVKKIRRIGASLEFDTIKDYSLGDEYRHINWKATGKQQILKVNQFQDEKSQPIYSFLDLSRTMRMPFNEMTLLDYSINASLVLSNISLLKHDKAGLLTFSSDVKKHLVADRKNHQMQLILEALYNIKTNFEEAEFGHLYTYMRKHIAQRSLIFLYTNFETLDALNRQIRYLRLMKKSHIVVVIMFKNTEMIQLAEQTAYRTIDIYNQVIAEKFINEKELIIQKLHQSGIQTIYTEPQNLTVSSLNKYLEIKARGLI